MELPAKVNAGEYVIKIKPDTSEVEAALADIKPSGYSIRLTALDRALSLHERTLNIVGYSLGLSPAAVVASAAQFESYLRDGASPSK